jgi:hypothetical protein
MQIIVVFNDHAGTKLGRRNSHCESISFDCGWPAEGGPLFPPDTWLECFILHALAARWKIATQVDKTNCQASHPSRQLK